MLIIVNNNFITNICKNQNFAMHLEDGEDGEIPDEDATSLYINDFSVNYEYAFTAKRILSFILKSFLKGESKIDLIEIERKLNSIWKYLEKIEETRKRELEEKKQMAKHGLSMMTALPEKEGCLSMHEEVV